MFGAAVAARGLLYDRGWLPSVRVEAPVVSVGGHAYRKDIRQAAYRFMNTHLKNDPRPVLDSEVDLLTGAREEIHPIPPQQLRAFPQDADIPKDALNARIDQEFVLAFA